MGLYSCIGSLLLLSGWDEEVERGVSLYRQEVVTM